MGVIDLVTNAVAFIGAEVIVSYNLNVICRRTSTASDIKRVAANPNFF